MRNRMNFNKNSQKSKKLYSDGLFMSKASIFSARAIHIDYVS